MSRLSNEVWEIIFHLSAFAWRQTLSFHIPCAPNRQRANTYVWTFNLKTREKQSKWILAGVAILLQPWTVNTDVFIHIVSPRGYRVHSQQTKLSQFIAHFNLYADRRCGRPPIRILHVIDKRLSIQSFFLHFCYLNILWDEQTVLVRFEASLEAIKSSLMIKWLFDGLLVALKLVGWFITCNALD